MGKHEREIVEQAEKIIVKLINKESISEKEKTHDFFELCNLFAEQIKDDYLNINQAKHVGNSYNSLGDIILKLSNNTEKYIELKFLESGFGTLANISQDALTELGIFKERSWSCFRKEKEHTKQIIEFLNEFDYPDGKIQVNDPKSKIHEKAKYLKKIVKSGNKNIEPVCKKIINNSSNYSENEVLAAKIILKIINFDKKIKIEYLKLLKEAHFNKNKLKLFSFLLLSGNHTINDLKENMNKDINLLIRNIDNYEVYYLYKPTHKIVKEANKELLKEILTKDIGIKIENGQTNLIIFLKNGIEKNILRVVYHWKNKFQGIQTPCLNIFKF